MIGTRCPKYPLAVRFLSCGDSPTAVALEVRDSREPQSVHRFRYDRRAHFVASWDHDSVDHPELTAHRDLPSKATELGHFIAALVHREPGLLQILRAPMPVPQASAGPTSAPRSSTPGPVSHAVSQVLRHLTAHWFGGAHVDWGFPRRFGCALLGSMTFFGAKNLGLVLRFIQPYAERGRPGADIADDISTLLNPWFTIPVIFLAAGGVAALTSSVDHRHGPVRLFLGAFLLPYLIWTLLFGFNVYGYRDRALALPGG